MYTTKNWKLVSDSTAIDTGEECSVWAACRKKGIWTDSVNEQAHYRVAQKSKSLSEIIIKSY